MARNPSDLISEAIRFAEKRNWYRAAYRLRKAADIYVDRYLTHEDTCANLSRLLDCSMEVASSIVSSVTHDCPVTVDELDELIDREHTDEKDSLSDVGKA